VVICKNPIAGRRPAAKPAEKLSECLAHFKLVPREFGNLKEATDFASECVGRGELRAVVGIGGDGTASAIVNNTPPGTPLAIFPAGTANLLARQFHYPRKPSAFAAMLARGRCARIDAGKVDDRLFLNMLSCGLDAVVTRRVHELRHSNPSKGHINYRTYLRPLVEALKTYSFPPVRIAFCPDCQEDNSGQSNRLACGEKSPRIQPEKGISNGLGPYCRGTQEIETSRKAPAENPPSAGSSCADQIPPDDHGGNPNSEFSASSHGLVHDTAACRELVEVSVRWGFIFNLKKYAWGLPLAPTAVVDDGWFEFCGFQKSSIWSALNYVLTAQLGGIHRFLPSCVYLRARWFRLSAEEPVEYQVDGDPGGFLPVEVEVVPRRVTLIVP